MRLSKRGWRITAASTAALVLAAAALAAPFVGEPRGDLPFPIRSLRGIKQVRIEIGQLPPEFVETGLAREKVIEEWTKKLTDRGFEVTDDKEVPKLSLSAFIVLDDDVPTARGYVFYIALDQPVHIQRLDETMPLPTYTDFIVGVESEKSIGKEIEDGVGKLIQNFTDRCMAASSSQ